MAGTPKPSDNPETPPLENPPKVNRLEEEGLLAWEGGKEKKDKIHEIPKPESHHEKNEWTILVNLSTNFRDEKDGSLLIRGANESFALKALALESKDKPVTIVVQAIHPTLHSSGKHQANEMIEDRRYSGRNFVLERYRIRNGQIETLHSPNSKDTLADLKDFMRSALAANPANKIGLINQSHGGGNIGIFGDHGNATLEDYVDSIKAGLKQSGHDKLDFFNADACLGAEVGAVKKYGEITHDVVASADYEYDVHRDFELKGGVGSVNLNVVLHSLLANPHMSGNQLSEECIRLANAGMNSDDGIILETTDGSNTRDGTPTLSHFNMTKLAQFSDALSIFTKDLQIAIEQPHNRDKIRSIIPQTLLFEPRESILPARDLTQFVKLIKKEIKAGTISDPTGNLLKHAENLTAAQHKLVQSYHSDYVDSLPGDKPGALSISLPSVKFFDQNEGLLTLSDAKKMTPIGKIYHCTSNIIGEREKISDKQILDTATKIRTLWKELRLSELRPSDQDELKNINLAMKRLDKTTNTEELHKSLLDIFGIMGPQWDETTGKKIAPPMTDSPVNRRFAEQLMRNTNTPTASKEFQKVTQPDLDVWRQFLVKLYK